MKLQTTIFSQALLTKGFSKNNTILTNIVIVLLGSLLLWVSAKVQVPFYPVPFTFQTLAILLIGAIFGWGIGFFTLSAYMLQGYLGLPVFAGTPEKGLGLAYILGPTGGYLLGFYLAVLIAGVFFRRGSEQKYWKNLLILIAANFSIYIPGILWLSQFTGWEKVLQFGFFPFILGDLFKIFLASLIVASFFHKKKSLE